MSSKQKNVLIMCNTDTTSDPRPNRMIHWLKDKYQVSVLAKNANPADIVTFYPLQQPISTTLDRFKKVLWLKLRRFDRYLWTPNLVKLADQLQQEHFDLIISHNLELLPFALEIRKSARVLFDAREYYPHEYDDQWMWRFLFKDLNEYLCRHFMTQCDQMITVSQTFATEYQREYDVKPEVVLSLPFYQALDPKSVDESRIRIIHHGAIAPSRQIEKMIYLMDHLDARFTLDLMLVAPSGDSYYGFLQQEASKRKNVRIIPPVHYTEIVSFTNQYDIGLFYLEPTNFSLRYTLANKLFEFIQARLAVAVTPTEMGTIVEKYDCGVVSSAFEIEAMAEKLNALSGEQITYYKHQSHIAAEILNARATSQQIQHIVQRLLGGDSGA